MKYLYMCAVSMHETSKERELLFAVAFRGVCRIGFDVMAVLSLVLRKAVISDSHFDAQPPSVHEVEVDLSRFDGSGLHKKLRLWWIGGRSVDTGDIVWAQRGCRCHGCGENNHMSPAVSNRIVSVYVWGCKPNWCDALNMCVTPCDGVPRRCST